MKNLNPHRIFDVVAGIALAAAVGLTVVGLAQPGEAAYKNTPPAVITYLSALLTPAIAFLAAHIAYQQWKLARNKLKLDLFDRRFKVYEAARAFLSSILKSDRVDDRELSTFAMETGEARWLLNDEIGDFLNWEIMGKALRIQGVQGELDKLPDGEEKDDILKEHERLVGNAVAQMGKLEGLFDPFMRLEH